MGIHFSFWVDFWVQYIFFAAQNVPVCCCPLSTGDGERRCIRGSTGQTIVWLTFDAMSLSRSFLQIVTSNTHKKKKKPFTYSMINDQIIWQFPRVAIPRQFSTCFESIAVLMTENSIISRCFTSLAENNKQDLVPCSLKLVLNSFFSSANKLPCLRSLSRLEGWFSTEWAYFGLTYSFCISLTEMSHDDIVGSPVDQSDFLKINTSPLL